MSIQHTELRRVGFFAIVFVLATRRTLYAPNNWLLANAFAWMPAISTPRTRQPCLARVFSTSSSSIPTSNQTEIVASSSSDVFHRHQQETYQTNLNISRLASKAPRDASAAPRAHRLLQQLPYPDTISYNGVMKAYSKSQSPNGAQMAQDLLEEMQAKFEAQSKASQEWHLENGERLRQQGDEAQHSPRIIRIKPNVRSYSTVMDAWSRRSGRVPKAAERAQAALDQLEQLYNTTGDLAFQPNVISYNTVIAAWAKDGGGGKAIDRARMLLERMHARGLADVISYNAVLLAWARSGLPHAGERAEALMRNMTLVNARTYTTVMDAWSRSHRHNIESADRAHSLLREMEDVYERTRDASVRPNCVSYSTVINAYALSKDPGKAQKAWRILQRMRQLSKSGENAHAEPSLITYNSVLNACATSGLASDLQVKKMVHSLYREIMGNPGLQADHFTYGTVLKACTNVFCGEKDNDAFVQSVFQQCCDAGQVSFGVCYQLRQAATTELYRQLIPETAYNPLNGHFSLQGMPPSWTRNVRERRTRDAIHSTRNGSSSVWLE